MNIIDEILEHYEVKEKQPLTLEEVNDLNHEASEHLVNYLFGDGDARHLHDYYDCLEKLN